ncbi:DNA polymerase I [Clostridium botulinum]|uniref:DNA polymerase I n=1 Tax=Clostridium botulinum TaxID=1491 RepID=UPI0004D8001F|nr:DNA polymerase I [Clostridium botulinum]KEI04250.1 DNA polymerase I [Clostridium botulinum C/D str. BKT75002]KEI12244.1 DNA polymerase I [Clostridium botulinum C/D str. BKT2873]KGM93594.1 DNA polymerase I [Clostridium botulinum D str. CCUG 7971]KOC48875.1 DNA polymerase I [Clostridium botulinum]MCD3351888.1 DNA polymerase I [Clostridium botulinum D/C]
MNKERLLILDGHSLMYRAFFALPPLTNKEGVHTNAIYGFIKMLLKMKEEIKPNYIVTAFDKKAPTFRHKEYEDYKAGRAKMPSELNEQFPIVKDILNKLAINIFEIDGFEADDLIGTLSQFAEKKGIEVYIVTGDKDALQLATDNVKIVINKKGMSEKEIYDRNRMVEEYEVTPTQFIDVKGLMGDKSDNIPGVPGIGTKTAFKLIKKYGSIENVLENVENISGKKMKQNLIEYREQAIFSKKLATICTNVPIEIDLEEIKSKENYDIEGVRQLFESLGFKSLIQNIVSSDNQEEPENNEEKIEKINIKVESSNIETVDKLSNLLSDIKDTVYFQVECVNENVYSKIEFNTIYIRNEEKIYVVNINKIKNENCDKYLELLKKLFEDENIKKISHDIKNIYVVLRKYDIDAKNFSFDTKIAAYLLQPSKSDYILREIILEKLSINIHESDEECKIKETYCIKEIYEKLQKEIKAANMEELFYNVELPLVKVLASMEYEGFKIDKDRLTEIGEKFKVKIETLEKEIHEFADEDFNIKSPKQLGKILFEKLDLPVIKKTKTGYSTNAEVLEKLKDSHPIISKIIEYRQITKLDSTYVEGLKHVIDKDGKIHSSFNQTVTTTGRLSSTEPNLQNIPIKYEMGREIRKVFVPNNEESVIFSADYSQIELRVLAHIANDEKLIDAFKHHKDIHTITASEVFKVPIDEVTPLMRSNAKAVNFGIVYGIGAFSLSKDINVSRKEAKEYIDTYFNRYPNVKKYIDDIISKAEQDGFVTTIMNRKRYIPEVQSRNKIVRSFGERLAMNTPIQGSAADLIKLAMVHVYEELIKRNFKSTLILQVHDELILNVYKDELEEVKQMVVEKMEGVMNLLVPLEADVNVGTTWYEAK